MVFQNNSKIVADIDTKLIVPTLSYINLTSNDQICPNRLNFFFLEIDVFLGSLYANFDQNRLNVKKFAKNRV